MNETKPYLLFTGTTHPAPGCPLYDELQTGSFVENTFGEYLDEEEILFSHLDLEGCYYFGLHPSNVVRTHGWLNRDRDRILKTEDVQILQAAVGSILNGMEHDEFVFSNTSSQAVRFVLEDSLFYLYSFTEALDYFGAKEDVAVWSVEKKEYPLIANKDFISTPIKEKVAAIRIVQEHQELFENNQKTYDVWVTRGIIIDFGDHELAFEKPIWFSEDIVIRKGYNLIEKFQPVEEICKAGKWKDGVTMVCSREVITLCSVQSEALAAEDV